MKALICLVMSLLLAVASNAGTAKRVACIGNSITRGSRLSHPERDSYPAALKRMLGEGWIVDNWGVSGSCASTDLKNMYMKNEVYPKVKASRPDIVTIFLGHDDARKPNQPGLKNFASGLSEMVRNIRSDNQAVRIFLVSPTKVFSQAYDNDDGVIRNLVLPAMRQVAEKEGVGFIDAYTPTEGDKEYFPDGVHPDANGAGHIAQILYKAITGKSRQYERPLSVPSVFSSHAVMQQHTDVAVWGYGAAGKKVTVKPSWGKAVTTIADQDGLWWL